MNNKIKLRIISLLLIISMLFTSIELTNIFNNDINAASSSTLAKVYTYSHTGNVQVFSVEESGTYQIELYGAAGGDSGNYGQGTTSYDGGKGGYVSFTTDLTAGQTLYIYAGARGDALGDAGASPGNTNGTTSGGGASFGSRTGAGGGATEIRLDGTNIENRLIVKYGVPSSVPFDFTTFYHC